SPRQETWVALYRDRVVDAADLGLDNSRDVAFLIGDGLYRQLDAVILVRDAGRRERRGRRHERNLSAGKKPRLAAAARAELVRGEHISIAVVNGNVDDRSDRCGDTEVAAEGLYGER